MLALLAVIGAAVLLALAVAAGGAAVALRLRQRPAIGAAPVAAPRPVPWQRTALFTARRTPAVEAPKQELHLHFHGVDAEDVAAIIRQQRPPG